MSINPGIARKEVLMMVTTLPPLNKQTRIVQKTTQLLDLVTQLEKHLDK